MKVYTFEITIKFSGGFYFDSEKNVPKENVQKTLAETDDLKFMSAIFHFSPNDRA